VITQNVVTTEEYHVLSTTYKIISHIFLFKITVHAEEIIGDYQCGFWHNRSTVYHIFCIRQILWKKMGI